MNKQNNIERYAQLLFYKWNEDLSSSENDELQSLTTRFGNFYDEITNRKNLVSKMKTFYSVNGQSAWERIKEHITSSNNDMFQSHQLKTTVTSMLMLTTMIYRLLPSPEMNTSNQGAPVEPMLEGEDRAILTIEDGYEVVLKRNDMNSLFIEQVLYSPKAQVQNCFDGFADCSMKADLKNHLVYDNYSSAGKADESFMSKKNCTIILLKGKENMERTINCLGTLKVKGLKTPGGYDQKSFNLEFNYEAQQAEVKTQYSYYYNNVERNQFVCEPLIQKGMVTTNSRYKWDERENHYCHKEQSNVDISLSSDLVTISDISDLVGTYFQIGKSASESKRTIFVRQ